MKRVQNKVAMIVPALAVLGAFAFLGYIVCP